MGPPDLLPELRTEVPGPRSRQLAARLQRVECADTTFVDETFPLFWERASGCNVWDSDGNRFVDLTAAFGVCILGHTQLVQRTAVLRQAGRLVHAMGDVHPAALKVELAEQLGRLAPGALEVVLFGNSGSDAIEAALKTSALATGRPGVVAFEGAYHGLGYGALSLTWRAHFRAPFRSQLNPHVVHLPYPGRGVTSGDGNPASVHEVLERLDALLASDAGEPLGAVVVEPIQGRGGVIVPAADFLPGLREICTRRGRLLVVDEILTGLGRTGSWFACTQAEVVPDLLCLGKSLAGGLPLSACIGTKAVMESWERSRGEARHTQTFLGNPLAAAVACATLNLLEKEAWPARVAERGTVLGEELAALLSGREGVAAIRGRGFLWGIECGGPQGPDGARVREVVHAALRRGWILLPAGDDGQVLELLPPYVLGKAQWRGMLQLLDELFSRIPARV